MESYEQKYKEALGWMKSLYGGLHGKTKEEAEKYFPELQESEDEKVKRIIHSISNKISFHLHDIFTEEEFQCFDAWSNAWLKKQGQQDDYDDNIITRDDEILQAISIGLTDAEKDLGWSDFGGLPIEEIHAWLEKQGELQYWKPSEEQLEALDYAYNSCSDTERGNYYEGVLETLIEDLHRLDKQGKPKWSDEDEERLQSCISSLQGKGLMGGVDTMDSKWLKSLKQRILDNSAKTCENDTLLDLLHKMPSCITVDGILYHFILRKTALAYTAYYAGEEEGEGKVIFVMTAFSPIDLLTDMLEELKEKGLLEGGQHE